MERKTHVSCYYPDLPPSPFDHMVFGEDKSAKEAFAQAKRFQKKHRADLLVFIEKTGARATIKFGCSTCDDRSSRQDYLLR